MAAVHSLKVFAIAGRTNSSGAAQTDVDQEELRMLATALMAPGYTVDLLTQAANTNAFKVRQDTGSNLQVKVGSGNIKRDGYVLLGSVAGQGAYIVRNDDGTGYVTLTVPAADAALPKKYRVFLYVNDAAYSGTASRAYAQLEVLAGTASASPVAPSPLAAWSAYVPLWEFTLNGGASAVTNTILDAGSDLRSASVLKTSPRDRFTISTSSPSGGQAGDVWFQV